MYYLNQKVITVFLLLLFLTTISLSVFSAEVEDLLGRKVELPERIDKIAAVGPGALRLVVYLEAENKIVGVEEFEKRSQERPYILAKPELLELPDIGPQFGGDAELIAAEEPDLIITSYLTEAELKNLQNKTRTPVISINDGSAGSMTEKDLKEALNFLGGILNKKERAADLINYFEAEKDKLKSRIDNTTVSKKLYIGGIGNKGAQGITSTEAAYPPFEYLGLKNVIEAEDKKNFTISKEDLLLEDPEIIFIDQGGIELVKSDLERDEYKYLQAYQNNNFYQLLPYNHYTTNFATMLANTYYIAKIIYPEEFEDIKPEAKADQIYKKFVGQEVYSKMAEIFGGFKKMDSNKFN
ncbi:MAG: ABC transporter substrate-binding protein [Halanaerobium sp.]